MVRSDTVSDIHLERAMAILGAHYSDRTLHLWMLSLLPSQDTWPQCEHFWMPITSRLRIKKKLANEA